MISETEAQELIAKLVELKESAKSKKLEDISALKKHEAKCIESFAYLVKMKTAKYRLFSNYDDLNQEGFEALIRGISTYDPQTGGSAFWWLHKYIDTKISRSANLHTTIRYPLKVAKKITPHKEYKMQVIVDDTHRPDKEVSKAMSLNFIYESIKELEEDERTVLNLVYGINVDKPLTVAKVCKTLDITRPICLRLLKSAIKKIRRKINLNC